MFSNYYSILIKMKEKYSQDKYTKEDVLDQFDWMIKNEKCKLIMQDILWKLKLSNSKDIDSVLTDWQKQDIEDAWGEYCSKHNTTSLKRFKSKLRFSVDCMKKLVGKNG